MQWTPYSEKSWDKEKQPNQWDSLVKLIKQKQPKKVAVNQSKHFALAEMGSLPQNMRRSAKP